MIDEMIIEVNTNFHLRFGWAKVLNERHMAHVHGNVYAESV